MLLELNLPRVNLSFVGLIAPAWLTFCTMDLVHLYWIYLSAVDKRLHTGSEGGGKRERLAKLALRHHDNNKAGNISLPVSTVMQQDTKRRQARLSCSNP